MLNIFGGKITTYRALSEAALNKLGHGGGWTAGAPLPGGDFAWDGVDGLINRLVRDFPFLDSAWAGRLVRTYGTDSWNVLASAKTVDDLGKGFGANLYEAELNWLIDSEFAQTGDDILWRRTKLGLFLNSSQRQSVDEWMASAIRNRTD